MQVLPTQIRAQRWQHNNLTLYTIFYFPVFVEMADNDNMGVEDFSDSSKLTTPVLEKETKTAIPNGGLLAWLQVLGSFLLFFNSW